VNQLADAGGCRDRTNDCYDDRKLDGTLERETAKSVAHGGGKILSSCEGSMSYPERIVPDETEPGVVALHVKRYDFARTLCEGCVVLDAACGVGYGSALLAETAARVVGVDVDESALGYARTRYARPNLEFVHGDLQCLAFEDGSFDVVCAFEAIEHLDRPETFVSEAARLLRDAGLFVASTPHVASTNREPENPYHRIELSRADFDELLRRSFSEVEILGQRRLETRRHRLARRLDVLGLRRRIPVLRRATVVTGTPATEHVTLDGVVISPERVEDATELVAVCRK
jgi:2-polyprenyl-3-methyl-5-hydroxy-6-metoxy-1,4-benzoquinol methylase